MSNTSKQDTSRKRPAAEASAYYDSEDTATKRRPAAAQPPRLVEVAEQTDKSASTGSIIGVDLTCQIASFMSIQGNGLHNLCVAVGRDDAAKIRHDYLLDNDGYVERNLQIVASIASTAYASTGK